MLSSWQIKGNNYRMVIFTWFLFLVHPFQQKIRHLFMNKSTCVEVVGSSTICQGTWEKYHPSLQVAFTDREERESLSENLASTEVQTLPKRSISLSTHPEF